jgi:hypothetical protein
MAELSENGGQSIKDQINRIDLRVDRLYTILSFDSPRHSEVVDKLED